MFIYNNYLSLDPIFLSSQKFFGAGLMGDEDSWDLEIKIMTPWYPWSWYLDHPPLVAL